MEFRERIYFIAVGTAVRRKNARMSIKGNHRLGYLGKISCGGKQVVACRHVLGKSTRGRLVHDESKTSLLPLSVEHDRDCLRRPKLGYRNKNYHVNKISFTT